MKKGRGGGGGREEEGGGARGERRELGEDFCSFVVSYA